MSLFTAGQERGLRSAALELQIAMNYANTDPLAGLRFFTSLPVTENGAYSGVGDIVREWAARDPVAAGNWVQGQTNSAWSADAIGAYAHIIRRTDPEAAARWESLLPQRRIQ
jgi:hypothetical protein